MACVQSKWTVHEGEIDREDVRALVAQHLAFAQRSSPPGTCFALNVDALAVPAIRLFSMREDGTLLGIGALRTLSADHLEIKTMRTADAALGRGVGRTMLDHLLSVARAMNGSRISLETGSGPPYEAANRLYASAGFTPCAPYGDYKPTDFNRFYTLEL